MSAESPRHVRSGGPLTVPSQPPSDRSIIDAVSGFINDVTLSSSSTVDPKDVIQWARFETADINEPTPEGDTDNDISPLLLILGYGAGVQVWLVPPTGEAQEVLSWRQGTVRVLRILPTPQHGDCFASKRPLIALCDSVSPGPTFCSLSFISIRGGEQVKSIKFKNPILDVLANKRSVVVSFSERFAVFDAATLEDRMAVTTCYPCPCPLGGSMPINPLALGDRWLAYADKKLNQSKRSSGGCEGEGVTSYTATVLHAAKSLSKGLRGLGESVAHSLAGGRSTSQSPSPPNADIQQPGVVTILDIEGIEEEQGQDNEETSDPIVAHFVAHSEAIIALKFDASGMLLVTADRRGHDFHVFRINPHPCGPSLASVHHLYILHRGDTTAKVQDIAISSDSRWTAISTLRGTTHVFAISPYGGACGVRTHTQPRVVNRLSRFHRSAGLPIVPAAHSPPARPTGSPVGETLSAGAWFPNPRLPPYPLPVTAAPLAQLRPTANLPTHTITRTSSGRQRLSSLSEDSNSVPLLARARFGLAVPGAGLGRASPAPVTALYLVTAGGTLLHLVLHPRPPPNVPKEKICDESPIEVTVEPVSQWALQRPPAAPDLLAPLPPANPLLRHLHMPPTKCADMCMSEEERWLSQVEIVTHAGPHRRLWMGPQFVFKTYNCTGSSSSLSEAEAVEVAAGGVARSNPVNMPAARPIVPVLIDSGSASSVEHSPSDGFRRKSLLADAGRAPSLCDVQLKEDLAEAMKEDHGWPRQPASGVRAGVARAVDPLGCVAPSRAAPAPAPRDPDAHTRPNRDEATFRPVVRAPAAPPPPPLLLRPLPRTTTIPVQPLPAPLPTPPASPPRPLAERVVIPAALGDAPPSPPPADSPPELDYNFADYTGGGLQPPTYPPPPPEVPDRQPSIDRHPEPSYPPPPEIPNYPPPEPEIPERRPSKPRSWRDDVTVESQVSKAPAWRDEDIKTEDQAWDMLLAEPERPPAPAPREPTPVAAAEEPKPKYKRNRKSKKAPEEAQAKTDDDSFVEIHAIEEKPQPSSGDLVSISSPFEDVDPCSSYAARGKKTRSLKSLTPERVVEPEKPVEIEFKDEISPTETLSKSITKVEVNIDDVEPWPQLITEQKKDVFKDKFKSNDMFKEKPKSNDMFREKSKSNDMFKEKSKSNTLIVNQSEEAAEEGIGKGKESPKSKKSKSLSPYFDSRKSAEKEAEIKDVYVIDSTKEEFPEIQITRGTKPRKKSPQPVEVKPQEVPVVEPPAPAVEKPIKSWSSIAANRTAKKEDVEKAIEVESKLETIVLDRKRKSPEREVIVDDRSAFKEVSLHEKLYELCKRTDIMVAQCDAPSELRFVEEHHAPPPPPTEPPPTDDLPPLEPLDFALDDFKLEVMRDSLLEVADPKLTSPICKINIDDILSSIKETTSRAIESSTFNLIDLERVPARRERGFSVVEGHKITSQEIGIDDEPARPTEEAMEKSSDDDNTSPIVSTDSDKEDKKTSSKSILPSTLKKSAKSKNSRRKKK